MTTQEAYEHIREYFSRPGAQFAFIIDEYGELRCRYRTPDGDGCAVGCLIRDEDYEPQLEGRSASGVLRTLRDRATDEHYSHICSNFAKAAQQAHDKTADERGSIPDFLETLDSIALEYGLTVVA